MSLDSLASLGQREWAFIRAQFNYLLDLPAPGAEWTVADAPAGVAARIHEFNGRGFIQEVGRASQYPTTYRYTTNSQAYEAIQAERERRDTLPCGHAGLSNLGDGNHACGYEYCDTIHTRDAIEEVLNS